MYRFWKHKSAEVCMQTACCCWTLRCCSGRGLSETFQSWGRKSVDKAEVASIVKEVESVQGQMKTGPHIQEFSSLSGLKQMPVKTYHRPLAVPLCPQVWTATSPGKSEFRLFLSTWTQGAAHSLSRLHVSFVLISFQEPFGEIDSRYKADLSPENAKLLNTFLNQIGLDAFLLELHEMMILKLKNPKIAESFNPEWRYGLASLPSEAHIQHSAMSPKIFHSRGNCSCLTAEFGFLLIYHCCSVTKPCPSPWQPHDW